MFKKIKIILQKIKNNNLFVYTKHNNMMYLYF